MQNKTVTMISSTERFSDVVENYIRYRPGYPKETIPLLNKRIGLTPNKIIADIGSGTGKSSELFLLNKNIVFGVEPNDAMRNASQTQFKSLQYFRSIRGTAEETNLPGRSVDIIFAGQAFHWFDLKKAKQEFRRILKPQGWVVLVWNERNDESPFLKEYENFLIHNSTDYADVNHKNVDEKLLKSFYSPMTMGIETLSYEQYLDFNGLKGRYLSCSYAYKEDHPLFDSAMIELQKLYNAFQEDGEVKMDYITKIYFGHVN